MTTTMQITWTGADGSTWDLSSGPVRLDKRPVEGFGDPEWTRSTRSYAGRHGQTRTAASIAKARSGFIPFFYFQKDAAARFVTSQAWWASWDPDESGTIRVTQPDGSYRTIAACFDDDDSWAPSYDPRTRETGREGVSWIADDPWWRGPTLTQSFGAAAAANFFGPSKFGPPFNISSSHALSTATLSNPGDRESAPRYYLDGPISGFDIAIDGHHVTGAFTVPSGSTLVLDADVAALSADIVASDGSVTPVDTLLSAADFAQVSPGGSVPLAATIAGFGSLRVELDPIYKRAW